MSLSSYRVWETFKPKRESSPDLCDPGAVLYQLSYQANWELVFILKILLQSVVELNTLISSIHLHHEYIYVYKAKGIKTRSQTTHRNNTNKHKNVALQINRKMDDFPSSR